MRINEILAPLEVCAKNNLDITGVTNDSREVQPGFMFVAYPGDLSDGREYINQAINQGASAIVFEPENYNSAILAHSIAECIPITQIKDKLAVLGSRFYNQPSKHLDVIGVTGTNGKTTIAHLLAQAFEFNQQKSGYVGTLGHGCISSLKAMNNTTPDGLRLQDIFHQLLKQKVKKVAMEVSSHALSLHRVDHVDFNVAVYTNLSHEHLDFHKTMGDYADAKAELFQFDSLRTAIFNHDDDYVDVMKKKLHSTVQSISYGIKRPADVRVVQKKLTMTGGEFEISSPFGAFYIKTSLLGLFNIYNLLAIFCCLMENGETSASDVESIMAKIEAVPGRMEVVAHNPCVIVDYAHSPDALDNALGTLNMLKKSRIITVFGCGGERDKEKRPMMGRVASKLSDHVIVTCDNPRHENPQDIIDEVCSGIDEGVSFDKISDREVAIRQAINKAEHDDIILVAGKGHEAYQQIGDKTIQFSDQEVIRKLLNKA